MSVVRSSAFPCPAGRRAAAAARAATAAVLVLLAGCSTPPTVPGEVARFHRWERAEPLTVAFRRTPEQAASLEYRSYEQRLRERLVALGFAEAEPGRARYEAALEVRATPEPRVTAEWWAPYGGFGYPGAFGPGPWFGPRPYFPYGRWDPFWAMPPTPVVRDLTVWRHEVRVDLYDVRAGAPADTKVHEARAVAVATTESLPRLVPGLIDAALAEFPGESGASRPVDVPLPDARR